VTLQDRPLFLVGFMGSGKSTVGRIVADELDRDFLDIDDLIVEREGRPIEEIFRDAGEDHFRDLEWQTLQSLDGRRDLVAATGGGLFLGADRRRWLRRCGTTVWLDAPLEVCVGRVPPDSGRPLWSHAEDPLGFRAMFEKRRASYALANIRVVASAAPEEVARLLLERLRSNIP